MQIKVLSLHWVCLRQCLQSVRVIYKEATAAAGVAVFGICTSESHLQDQPLQGAMGRWGVGTSS